MTFNHCILLILLALFFPGISHADEKSDLEAEQARLRDEITSLERAESQNRDEISRKQSESARLEGEEQLLLRELQDKRNQLTTLTNEADANSQSTNDFKAKKVKAEADLVQIEAEIKDLRLREIELQSDQAHYTAQHNELLAQKKALDNQLTKQQEQLLALGRKHSDLSIGLEEQKKLADVISETDQNLQLIIGKDDYDIALRQSLGFIVAKDGSYCSGFLASRNTIKTAAHCLGTGSDDLRIDGYTFRNLDGNSVPLESVIDMQRARDSVTVTVAKPLDEAHFLTEGPVDETKPLQFYYYDAKNNFAFTYVCSIIEIHRDRGYFVHDCPSEKGASGGVFLQSGKVVGLHVGRYDNERGLARLVLSSEPSFAEEISQLHLEYNCDSDCGRDAPRICIAGRCSRRVRISDPVCEAAKAAACAARETERAIAAVVDGLRHANKQLNDRKGQLRISVDGLERSLRDLNNTVLGRNESIKHLNQEILAVSAQIDEARIRVTEQSLRTQELKGVLKESLRVLQVSEADRSNILSGVKQLESSNIAMLEDNKAIAAANETLKNTLTAGEQSLISLQDAAERVSRETGQLIENNTASINKIAEKTKLLGVAINEAALDLKRDISLKNAEALGKKIGSLAQATVVKNLLKIGKWLSERLADSPPKGPALVEARPLVRDYVKIDYQGRKIFLVNNNNNALANALGRAVFFRDRNVNIGVNENGQSRICGRDNAGGGDDTSFCFEGAESVGRQWGATAGMVCEQELFDAVRAGETGVYWVQIPAAEYCRLRYQHFADTFRNGYRRSMSQAWCRTVWSTQELDNNFGGHSNTFRCIDLRPELKKMRDEVADHAASKQDTFNTELATLDSQVNSLLEARVEKEVDDAQRQAVSGEAPISDATPAQQTFKAEISESNRNIRMMLSKAIVSDFDVFRETMAKEMSYVMDSAAKIDLKTNGKNACIRPPQTVELMRRYFLLGVRINLLSELQQNNMPPEFQAELSDFSSAWSVLQPRITHLMDPDGGCEGMERHLDQRLDPGQLLTFDLRVLAGDKADNLDQLQESRNDLNTVRSYLKKRADKQVDAIKRLINRLDDEQKKLFIYAYLGIPGLDNFVRFDIKTLEFGLRAPDSMVEAEVLDRALTQAAVVFDALSARN